MTEPHPNEPPVLHDSAAGPRFVHLAARSHYSLGESVARVDALCRAAASDGQPALGLCDVMTLAGAPAFEDAARRLGLRAIFGLEVRLARHRATLAERRFVRERVLAADDAGCRRLVQLVNLGRARETAGTPAYVTWDEFLAEPAGLVYLLGAEGSELADATNPSLADDADALMRVVLDRTPPGRVMAALDNPSTEEGCRAARWMWAVAEHFELPAVATPIASAATPEDDLARRFFSAEAWPPGTTVDALQVPRAERPYLRPSAPAADLFREFPDAADNTARVAGLCRVELPRAAKRFPSHAFSRGVDADSYLWNEVFSRATEKYSDAPPRWRDRLNREFRELVEADLADALVCLARLDAELSDRGVLRGPGAGFLTHSLAASLLGLTRIDPLKFDLPFELPEGRSKEFPLLEIKAPTRQLDDAVGALRDLFKGRVCPVGRWQRWTDAAALESALRRLGRPKGSAQAMARSAAWRRAREEAELAPHGCDPDGRMPLDDERTLAWLVHRVADAPRAPRAAAAEYAFTVDPIDSVLPTAARTSGSGRPTEWEAGDLERLGYGRVAFTHDPALDLLEEATGWLRRQGIMDDPMGIDPDDGATFTLLREGATLGAPVLETPSVRARLRQHQPVDLKSLARVLATEAAERGAPVPSFRDAFLAFGCIAVKAHAPAAFYAAALSQAAGHRGRTIALLDEAMRQGLELRPIDINLSVTRWAPEDKALRPGFQIIEGFPESAAEELLLVRREMDFQDLVGLLRRTHPRRLKTEHVEALLRAGALDDFPGGRRALLDALPGLGELLRPRCRPAGKQDGDPLEFFGQSGEWWIQHHGEEDNPVPGGGAQDAVDWLAAEERKWTGLVFAIDPEAGRRGFYRAARVIRPDDLALKHRDRDVTFCAAVESVQADPRRPGEYLVEAGGCQVRAAGRVAREAERCLHSGEPFLVAGLLARANYQWSLTAEWGGGLDAARTRADRARGLELDLARCDATTIKEVLALFKAFPGNTPVRASGDQDANARLVAKVGGRKVFLCPGVEVMLMRLLGRRRWRAFVDGAQDAGVLDATLTGRRESDDAVQVAVDSGHRDAGAPPLLRDDAAGAPRANRTSVERQDSDPGSGSVLLSWVRVGDAGQD